MVAPHTPTDTYSLQRVDFRQIRPVKRGFFSKALRDAPRAAASATARAPGVMRAPSTWRATGGAFRASAAATQPRVHITECLPGLWRTLAAARGADSGGMGAADASTRIAPPGGLPRAAVAACVWPCLMLRKASLAQCLGSERATRPWARPIGCLGFVNRRAALSRCPASSFLHGLPRSFPTEPFRQFSASEHWEIRGISSIHNLFHALVSGNFIA